MCRQYRSSHVQKLNPGDLLYNQVVKLLHDMSGDVYMRKLKEINMIVNPSRYHTYRQTTLHDKSPGTEEFVVHGTVKACVPLIIAKGFDRCFNKGAASGRSRMGKGTYTARKMPFSMDNNYSPPDSNGDKHVFLCRAYPGKIANETVFRSSIHYAPDGYSSVESNDKIILVLYEDQRIIPEFHLVFSS
jgi:poly [ADP-ribose] polymerase 10/14/15